MPRSCSTLFHELSEDLVHNPTRIPPSARSIDPLFNESLDPLTRDLGARDRKSLDSARAKAIQSLHDYAGWLEQRLPSMTPWKPLGEANYNHYLKNVLLLPLDARDVAHLGEVELARYRALEAMLPDPSYADPDPQRAKSSGGLDREAAEGEAAGAVSHQTQKIWYITGKWQIMRLLGRCREAKGPAFRLGQFQDELLANGSLPLSIVQVDSAG